MAESKNLGKLYRDHPDRLDRAKKLGPNYNPWTDQVESSLLSEDPKESLRKAKEILKKKLEEQKKQFLRQMYPDSKMLDI